MTDKAHVALHFAAVRPAARHAARPVPPRAARAGTPAAVSVALAYALPLFFLNAPMTMERFTISLDDPLAQEFDQMITRKGYGSRSEAVRDLIRQALETQQAVRYAAPYSVAVVSYVYNHHEKALADRLISARHAHHDLATSTMHAHLDHDHCLEAVFLQGRTAAVQQFAQQTIAQSGVRHGAINLIAAETEAGRHRHADVRGQPHSHLRPKR